MGDDKDTGSPTPGRRAPWERPISRVTRPDAPDSAWQTPSSDPPADESTARDTPAGEPSNDASDAEDSSSNPVPEPSADASRRAADGSVGRRLSVAELLDKVSRMSHGGSPGRPETPSQPPTPSTPTPNTEEPSTEEPSPRDSDSREVDAAHDVHEDDAPTVVLPSATTPAGQDPPTPSAPGPSSTPPPSTPPHSTPPPSARRPEPEAVGPLPPPALTRLALNKARKRKRLRIAGRTAVSMVAVLSLMLTGVVWGYLHTTDRGFAQVSALDTESSDVVDAPGQFGDETYLIVGTDTRAGASGEIGAGTVEDAAGARSDTIMLINIPADRSRVVGVSFPRDLDVERPVCEGWDSTTGDYDGEIYPAVEGDKLNATYALGGPRCLVKTIQRISGLRISHFVGIDFAGFETMVDEVGGVEVCTSVPLEDAELGTILPTTGEQTVDGRTALNYVRARNVASEGNGDYGRITRQQRFLSSLLRSVLSNRVLFDPGALNGFVNAFTANTFVENVKTADLLTLGQSLRNVEAGRVTFLTTPTDGTNYYGNEIPRTDDIDAIFRAIIDDLPLPGEERGDEPAAPPVAPTEPSTAVDPSLVSVQVSNGSDISGLAMTTANELANWGFQVVGTGNAESPGLAQTVVRYAPGFIDEASTLASTLDGAVLEETVSLGSVVEVVLGTEFPGFVNAPTPVGELLPTFDTGLSGAPTDVALPTDLAVTNAADDTCL